MKNPLIDRKTTAGISKPSSFLKFKAIHYWGKTELTSADALSGGVSPTSYKVRLAIPNPLGDKISCRHSNPDGG